MAEQTYLIGREYRTADQVQQMYANWILGWHRVDGFSRLKTDKPYGWYDGSRRICGLEELTGHVPPAEECHGEYLKQLPDDTARLARMRANAEKWKLAVA